MYSKRNNLRQVFFVDREYLCQCNLVPAHTFPSGRRKMFETELGKGLVRKEALDLLGYVYTESDCDTFIVRGDVAFVCRRPY